MRWAGAEAVFESGARFPFSVLRGLAPNAGVVRTRPEETPVRDARSTPSFWTAVHALESDFKAALDAHQGPRAVGAMLDLDRAIWGAHESAENSELVSQARELQAELLVLLGSHVESLPGSREECLEPLVSALLELRDQLRREGRWADGDAIRETLARAQVIVEDTRDGPRWEIR